MTPVINNKVVHIIVDANTIDDEYLISELLNEPIHDNIKTSASRKIIYYESLLHRVAL